MRRPFTSLLIAFLISPTLAQQATAPPATGAAEAQKIEPLSEEERSEALRLTRELIELVEKTNSFDEVRKKLFVGDFTARIRNATTEHQTLLHVCPRVADQADAADLERFYLSSMSAALVGMRLWIAAERMAALRRGENPDELPDDVPDPKLDEIVPPEVMAMAMADPFLRRAIGEAMNETTSREPAPAINPQTANAAADGRSAEEKDECEEPNPLPINSIERLRYYNSLLERAIGASIKYLDTLPTDVALKLSEVNWHRGEGNPRTDLASAESIDPRPWVLEKKFLGLSPGTRILCTTFLLFHVDIIRDENGKYRILHVLVEFD